MLIKEELKKVPPCKCPKLSKKELSKNPTYSVTVKICEVQHCGEILVADYYSTEDSILQVRFFSDAKNYISYVVKDDKWTTNAIRNLLHINSSDYFSYKISEYIEALKFLDVQKPYNDYRAYYIGNEYLRCEGVFGVCSKFIQEVNHEKHRKASDRKWEKEQYHHSLFPHIYSEKVNLWAEEKVFDTTYIFFTKLDKKRKRRGLCGHCGKWFNVPANIKHNSQGECPECHRKATFCADRYKTSKVDKATICYPFKKDGQLLVEWSNVYRQYFANGKPYFTYDKFARTLYLNEKGVQKIYSYGTSGYFFSCGGWCSWGRTPIYREAFTYSEELHLIFGEKYYNVNLKQVVESEKRPFDFIKLLDNLKNIPQTEYLCKLGLTMLASQLTENDYSEGSGFSKCLGVNQQYLPLYREYGVTASEHRAIKASKEYLTPLWLEQYRMLKSIEDMFCVDDLLMHMTIHKLCKYLKTQQVLRPSETLPHIAVWLRDYINMNESLDIRLSKSNMFPKDIKAAHDIINQRYQIVMEERRKIAKEEALELVYDIFDCYTKNGYTVLTPKSREDFIREGQELSHCVGGQSYYDRHVAGEKMIFFVRKAEKPEKAFYTAEIDMVTFIVTQLYGYGDKPATPEVRKFTKEFAHWLKGQKKKLRKAG